MSPEVAVVPPWRNIFKSPAFRENLCLVAVNEAHCITEWYGSQQLKGLCMYTFHLMGLSICVGVMTFEKPSERLVA